MDKPITPFYSPELVARIAEELRRAVERTKAGDLKGSAFKITITVDDLETPDETPLP